jgi:HD superfamily phosphohydrolase
MAGSHQIRDPVHNFLELWDEEIKLVGTPLFQRLRDIRQLAMANLLYPGAVHTRFDHSLGVCHVAGLLAKQLGLNPDETRLVRLAALLHDLGHGPFSHVSETLLERYADRSSLAASQKKDKIHELVTAHLIEKDPGIRDILGGETCRNIVKLLAVGHGQPALRSIVSGPLDADKQDYLLRDGRFCGVEYGVYDIRQLHRSLVLHGDEEEKELMIDPDGLHAVEQYVLAKYYMTTNVYRHRVRLVTDQMIVRAIVLGIEEDDLDELGGIFQFDNSPEFFEQYTKWTDARLLIGFDADARPGTWCGRLLKRLQLRQLHKRVYSEKVREFDAQIGAKLLEIGERHNDALRHRIEGAIAEILRGEGFQQIDDHEVILHGFDIKSVRSTSRNDEASMLVRRLPQPKPFEDESSLFASINEGYSEGFVEVYAPVAWQDRTQRMKLFKKLKQPIRDALEGLITGRCARESHDGSERVCSHGSARFGWRGPGEDEASEDRVLPRAHDRA